MKKIFIVGGGGYALECHFFLSEIIKRDKEIKFGGFLGQGGYGDKITSDLYKKYYLGDVSNFDFQENDYCIIGAGLPTARKIVAEELKKKQAKFYNLILSLNDIPFPENIELGEGNIIINSSFTVGIKIGDFNVFNGQVIIGHGTSIGNYNFFAPRVQLLGNTKIGNENQIGANTILLPETKIGDNNKIAPLSAIYKGCKNNCYMLGNPALKIGNI